MPLIFLSSFVTCDIFIGPALINPSTMCRDMSPYLYLVTNEAVLRKIRGTSSRRIVADKIRLLKEHGILEEIPGKESEKRYKIKNMKKFNA